MDRAAALLLSLFLAAPAAAVERGFVPPPAAPEIGAPAPAVPEIPFLSPDTAHLAPFFEFPPSETPQVAQIREVVARDLVKMGFASGQANDPLIPQIAENANGFLAQIDAHLRAGEIDPSVEVRTSEADSPKPVVDRPLRVGFYGIAGDPPGWHHLLIGLQAMARLKLDKVVFVIQGDDPVRKPNMTKADKRHPMNQAALEDFSPFFVYSSIAVGTSFDAETNLFRFLDLNPDQAMEAFYIVGGDHYRRLNDKGDPDTIGKMEIKVAEHRQNPGSAIHRVHLVFTDRQGGDENVATDLDVTLLPKIPFEASSTAIKQGVHLLMPYKAYEHARREALYNFGEPSEPPKAK